MLMLMGRSGIGDSGEDPGSGYYRELPLKLLLLYTIYLVLSSTTTTTTRQAVQRKAATLNYSLTVIERVLTSTREQISKT